MIIKIGLAVVRKKRLLLVQKKGMNELILPGGKPEGKETRLQALKREIHEELNVGIRSPQFIGRFTDKALGKPGKVTVHLYAGKLRGSPTASSEIASIKWVTKNTKQQLSPVLKNKIMHYLARRGFI